MARYKIFEKTKNFSYKLKGDAEGKTGGDAIVNLRKRSYINPNSPYIAIPTKVFMKYQLNPMTKTVKVGGRSDKKVVWKKPR